MTTQADETAVETGVSTSDATPLVVLMAASTGGIPAIGTVLRTLPASFPAAVIVSLHRSPRYPSVLGEILQRATKLPVHDAVEGARLSAGQVYVSRPDQHLTFAPGGLFRYVDGRRIRHVRSTLS